jgi:hypothetical protein
VSTNRLIHLPFDGTFLSCTISTNVFTDRRIRGLREIRDIVAAKGFAYCNENLDPEKKRDAPDWWNDVRTIAEHFSWDLFAKPGLPTVKCCDGTLEFQDGCHRAIGLAVAALRDDSLRAQVPVLLQC